MTYGNVTSSWHGNTTAAITLTGAGSTSVTPLINSLSSSYSQLDPSVQISYQSVGSGAGISDLIAKTTDFSASDLPLTNAQRAAAPNSLTIPDTVGAVAVAYNVLGLPAGLRMNATILAKIFLGTITAWNDPAITQLNPTLTLPSQTITVVHRSDASGTTFVFTGYLNTAASGIWTLGQGTTVAWPVGLGAAGNQGEASVIQATPNTIGYVELSYALSNNMKLVYLRNADGNNFVQPTLASVAASVSNSSTVFPQGNASWASVSLLNAHGANSYPIVSFSYALVYQQLNVVPGMTLDQAKALANFLWYTVHGGQQRGMPLNYVPLPVGVVLIDEATIFSMRFGLSPLLETSPVTPVGTISVQPGSIVDLSRTMKQVTVEIALNNTPDIPPYNLVSVQLGYDFRVLQASSLDYSTNVFTQTGFPTSIVRDCLDGRPAIGGQFSWCGSDDTLGIVSFAESILSGSTPDGTQGNIFFVTFNVNATSSNFSQIRFISTLLANGRVTFSTTTLDGYYTSQNCGGQPCKPGAAKFTWSPQPVKQGQFVVLDASASLPTSGATITDYFWRFGDTASLQPYRDSGTNSTVSYIYEIDGNYSATLTITDSNGIKLSLTARVNVAFVHPPPPNPAGAPPYIAEFQNVHSIQVLIQSVGGDSINASQTFTFSNATSPRTFFLSGNVATGAGNLAFWILAGGLTTGSPIYNLANAPTINYTDTESVSGAPRQVVHLNILANAGAAQLNWAWDQTTGVLVSFYANAFFQNGTNPNFGNATAKITSTSLWSPSSFSISVNPSNLSFFVNSTSPPTAQITLTSHNFAGTVQIFANIDPLDGLTVNIGSANLNLTLNGQAKTTLTPIISATTPPTTYFVDIIATAGIQTQRTPLSIIVLPTGDFAIQARPTVVTIQKSGTFDPSAVGTSTITFTSLHGFSGEVHILASSSSPLDLQSNFFAVFLTNSSNGFTLTISAANASPGTYLVNVTGVFVASIPPPNATYALVLRHSVLITVQVIVPPPDFQVYLSVPFGGNQIFAGSSTVVGVQLVGSGNTPFTGTVALSGQVSPSPNNGPALSFNPSSLSLQVGFASSQLIISTTALTPPGNYTITVTATGGSVTHTAILQLVVLPPPILTVSPSSGLIGTQVTVHGSGFVNPSQGPFAFPVEIQVTFDDQLIGLFFIQGSSFNFTFNIPVSQTGIIHQIHAKELFPSNLDVQTSFLVLAPPNTLSVTVSSGTIYFRGDTATVFAVTSINGQPASVTSLQIILILPNGTSITLPAVLMSNGVYRATFAVLVRGVFGTYAVIVKAHQTGSSDAFALTSFQVKPTWLQSNSRNITIASIIGAIGALGFVAVAWQKGYLGNRKKDLAVTEELRI